MIVDKLGGQLVQEVPPLPRDFLVDAGELALGLVLAACYPFLRRETVFCAVRSLPLALAVELGAGIGSESSESVAKSISPRSIPTTLAGSAGGIATSGISNSTVRLTYQWPSASRRNVALLVWPSMGRLWRMLTQPILGT